MSRKGLVSDMKRASPRKQSNQTPTFKRIDIPTAPQRSPLVNLLDKERKRLSDRLVTAPLMDTRPLSLQIAKRIRASFDVRLQNQVWSALDGLERMFRLGRTFRIWKQRTLQRKQSFTATPRRLQSQLRTESHAKWKDRTGAVHRFFIPTRGNDIKWRVNAFTFWLRLVGKLKLRLFYAAQRKLQKWRRGEISSVELFGVDDEKNRKLWHFLTSQTLKHSRFLQLKQAREYELSRAEKRKDRKAMQMFFKRWNETTQFEKMVRTEASDVLSNAIDSVFRCREENTAVVIQRVFRCHRMREHEKYLRKLLENSLQELRNELPSVIEFGFQVFDLTRQRLSILSQWRYNKGCPMQNISFDCDFVETSTKPLDNIDSHIQSLLQLEHSHVPNGLSYLRTWNFEAPELCNVELELAIPKVDDVLAVRERGKISDDVEYDVDGVNFERTVQSSLQLMKTFLCHKEFLGDKAKSIFDPKVDDLRDEMAMHFQCGDLVSIPRIDVETREMSVPKSLDDVPVEFCREFIDSCDHERVVHSSFPIATIKGIHPSDVPNANAIQSSTLMEVAAVVGNVKNFDVVGIRGVDLGPSDIPRCSGQVEITTDDILPSEYLARFVERSCRIQAPVGERSVRRENENMIAADDIVQCSDLEQFVERNCQKKFTSWERVVMNSGEQVEITADEVIPSSYLERFVERNCILREPSLERSVSKGVAQVEITADDLLASPGLEQFVERNCQTRFTSLERSAEKGGAQLELLADEFVPYSEFVERTGQSAVKRSVEKGLVEVVDDVLPSGEFERFVERNCRTKFTSLERSITKCDTKLEDNIWCLELQGLFVDIVRVNLNAMRYFFRRPPITTRDHLSSTEITRAISSEEDVVRDGESADSNELKELSISLEDESETSSHAQESSIETSPPLIDFSPEHDHVISDVNNDIISLTSLQEPGIETTNNSQSQGDLIDDLLQIVTPKQEGQLLSTNEALDRFLDEANSCGDTQITQSNTHQTHELDLFDDQHEFVHEKGPELVTTSNGDELISLQESIVHNHDLLHLSASVGSVHDTLLITAPVPVVSSLLTSEATFGDLICIDDASQAQTNEQGSSTDLILDLSPRESHSDHNFSIPEVEKELLSPRTNDLLDFSIAQTPTSSSAHVFEDLVESNPSSNEESLIVFPDEHDNPEPLISSSLLDKTSSDNEDDAQIPPESLNTPSMSEEEENDLPRPLLGLQGSDDDTQFIEHPSLDLTNLTDKQRLIAIFGSPSRRYQLAPGYHKRPDLEKLTDIFSLPVNLDTISKEMISGCCFRDAVCDLISFKEPLKGSEHPQRNEDLDESSIARLALSMIDESSALVSTAKTSYEVKSLSSYSAKTKPVALKKPHIPERTKVNPDDLANFLTESFAKTLDPSSAIRDALLQDRESRTLDNFQLSDVPRVDEVLLDELPRVAINLSVFC